MRGVFILILIGGLLVCPSEGGSQAPRRTGTIVPRPSVPEAHPDELAPMTFRIVNRSAGPIYLQGTSGKERRLELHFYHREGREGWKPFFESLPCDLPTCRRFYSSRPGCARAVPFIIALGPSGAPDSVYPFQWEGLLYQRSEATEENRNQRYCYKGWIPKSGRLRVEVEFSKTVQDGMEKRGMIGGRDHAAIEFNLPAAQSLYEIFVGN